MEPLLIKVQTFFYGNGRLDLIWLGQKLKYQPFYNSLLFHFQFKIVKHI